MRHLYARQASVPDNITVCASLYQGLAAKTVLTLLCTLQECGSLGFNVPVVTPPTTPPYFLIVYDDRNLIPTVYPLTVEHQFTNWTVVYPVGQSHSLLPTFMHQSP